MLPFSATPTPSITHPYHLLLNHFRFRSTTFRGVLPHKQVWILARSCSQSIQAASFRHSPEARFSSRLLQKPRFLKLPGQQHYRQDTELLTCDPNKRVLPKFEFLASKGASHSDILVMVTRSPHFVLKSLENHTVPMFELVRRFCPSDEKAISCVIACSTSIGDYRVHQNVKWLLDEGLTESNIHHLLRTRPSILCSIDWSKTVEEVKQLGFDPSKFDFSVALLAKRAVTKSQWDAKVETFKTWGWSEQEIFYAFRRHPQVMLRSKDKLNAVMSFWIGQLGWDPSALRGRPALFGFSLEKRPIPRASVIQYLLSKGLMKKNASIVTPFCLPEKLFLQKLVNCFRENDSSQLLKLYRRRC